MAPHSRSQSCDDDMAGRRQLGFFPVVSAEDLRQPAEVSRRLQESPLKRLLSVPNLVPKPLPKLTIRTKPMRRTSSEAAVLSQDCSPLLSERCSELSSSSSEPICIPSFRLQSLRPEAQILEDVGEHSGARTALPRLAEGAQLEPSPLRLLSELETRLRQVDDAAASPVAHLRDTLHQQSLLVEECHALRELHPAAAELFSMDVDWHPGRLPMLPE